MKNIILDGIEYDLAHMSVDRLIEAKIKIDDEIDTIKDQLNRAEALVKMEGIYSNPDWYWSARRARNHKQRQSQVLQLMIAQKKKVDKLKNVKNTEIDGFFKEAAKELLDKSVYYQIVDRAKILRLEREQKIEKDLMES